MCDYGSCIVCHHCNCIYDWSSYKVHLTCDYIGCLKWHVLITLVAK